MKKLIVCTVLLLSLLFAVNVAADTPITVQVDTNPVSFDVNPQIIDGRTMVPLRAIFEALGATVEWDQSTKTVTSTYGSTTIKLTIGSNQMYVNGNAKTLDVPGQIINGRTLVPVRAISEAFGCQVGWDGANKVVSVIGDAKNYTMLYAPNNRSFAVANSAVTSYLNAGWYRTPELKSRNASPEILVSFIELFTSGIEANTGMIECLTYYMQYRDSQFATYFYKYTDLSYSAFSELDRLCDDYDNIAPCKDDISAIVGYLSKINNSDFDVFTFSTYCTEMYEHILNVREVINTWY